MVHGTGRAPQSGVMPGPPLQPLALRQKGLASLSAGWGAGALTCHLHDLVPGDVVVRVIPLLKSVAGREKIDIIDIKAGMGLSVFINMGIQPGDKIRPAVDIPDIAVSHQPIPWPLEIILNDGTMINLFDLFPHLTQRTECFIQFTRDRFRTIGNFRELTIFRDVVWM